MALGAAMLAFFLKLALGYLLWVAVVLVAAVLVARAGQIKRARGTITLAVLMIVLIGAPPLYFLRKMQQRSEHDRERQRVERIDLAEARDYWPVICSAPPPIQLHRHARGRQAEILVSDAKEENYPTYTGLPIPRPGSSAVYPGSPFSVAVERVPIRKNDPLCAESKGGCPTHAYRVWRGSPESRSAQVEWATPLHFTLTIEKPKPTSKRFVESQTITLAEDSVALATSRVPLFHGEGNPANEYCQDHDQLVRSMIELAFQGQAENIGSEKEPSSQ